MRICNRMSKCQSYHALIGKKLQVTSTKHVHQNLHQVSLSSLLQILEKQLKMIVELLRKFSMFSLITNETAKNYFSLKGFQNINYTMFL